MFEDALMESSRRIRTHAGWFSGVAAVCNGSLLGLLLLWPLLHPASLPRQTLSMLLTAPAPPAAPLPPAPHVASATPRTAVVINPFIAPRIVPTGVKTAKDQPAPAFDAGLNPLIGNENANAEGVPGSLGIATPPTVRVAPPPTKTKLSISSGVMKGNKVGGADPQYPAIARAAHVQGIVVLAATISKSGTIENLRVVSGPPMLSAAAVDAVRLWRYRPYLLNGQPVEVETTVQVVFNLGG